MLSIVPYGIETFMRILTFFGYFFSQSYLMELKLSKRFDLFPAKLTLNRTLWNWNPCGVAGIFLHSSLSIVPYGIETFYFFCTHFRFFFSQSYLMELKQTSFSSLDVIVLTLNRTLWNWNKITKNIKRQFHTLSIVPYGIETIISPHSPVTSLFSQSYLMELKLVKKIWQAF